MAHRPAYERIGALNGSWYIYNHPQATASAQITTLYSKSTNIAQVGSFYAVTENNLIIIKGDNVDPLGYNRQVRAEWLTLPATFDGWIAPGCEREMATAVIQLRKNCSWDSPISLLRRCYFELMIPITIVQHRLTVAQSDERAHAAVAALQREDLLYLRWLENSESIGPSCVRLTFGSTFCHRPDWQMTIAGYAQVCTEHRTTNQQLFPAYRDQNGHSALGLMGHIQAPLLVNADRWGFVITIDVDSTCLLSRTQSRTFDLYEKRWSRYMLYNSLQGNTNIAGTQVLTIPVTVNPYNQTDAAFMVNFEQPHYHAALGYAIWGRSQESICDPCIIPPWYGIAGTGTSITQETTLGNTASGSTINKLAANDNEFTPFSLADVNLCSGSSPATFTNSIIGFLRYQHRTDKIGISAAIGGWHEMARANLACNSRGLWVQVTGTW